MTKQIKWEQVGDVLEVSGVLAKVGKFTPSDGEAVKFNQESLKNLVKNVRSNIPLWFLHQETGRKIPAGWISKLGLSKDGNEIHYGGKVFNTDVIPLIKGNTFNKTSMEADLELGPNNLVLGGMITGNAFVENPAVDGTRVRAKKVAMEYGGVTLEDIDEFLKGKGLSEEDIQKAKSAFERKRPPVVDKKDDEEEEEEEESKTQETEEETTQEESSTEEEKTEDESDNAEEESKDESEAETDSTNDSEGTNPSDDQDDSGESDMDEEMKKQFEQMKAENEALKKRFEEGLKKEFSSLVDELKNKGYKDPEKLVDGMDTEAAVGMLKKFQEAAPVPTGGIESGGSDSTKKAAKESKDKQFSRVLEEMGLTEVYNELFPEGK